MKPAISIIMPVYNDEPYLRSSLNSILSQTFTDFEVIVVNDGSTDNSGIICDEYAAKDERVKVIHKEYGGVSSARNAGVNSAKGEFIGFVDGDDRIDPNMYQSLYEMCKETKSDISICQLGREVDGKLINKDKKNLFIREMNHVEALRQLFKGELYRFSLCNKLFKRGCFAEIQFPEGRIHEDLATTYKLFANSNKAVYSNFIGYIYIKRQNSILTTTFNEKRLDAFIGWDEILTFIKQRYPNLYKEVLLSFVYWSVDNAYYILNQVEDKEESRHLLSKVQSYIRKYHKDISKLNSLSFKYKYIVTLLGYNTRLLSFSNSIKKHLLGA